MNGSKMRKAGIFLFSVVLLCSMLAAGFLPRAPYKDEGHGNYVIKNPTLNRTTHPVIGKPIIRVEDIMRVRNEYGHSKEVWNRIRQKFVLHRHDPIVHRQMVEASKNLSIHCANVLLKHLQYIESKLNNSGMNETLKIRIQHELRLYIGNLTAWKEGLNNTVNSTEIVKKVKVMARVWARVRNDARLFGYRLVLSKIERAVYRIDIAEEKIRNATEKLENAGVNTTEIIDKLESIDDKLSDIKAKLENLKVCLKNENKSEILECLKSKDVIKTLKDAREEYREIVEELEESVQLLKTYAKSNKP